MDLESKLMAMGKAMLAGLLMLIGVNGANVWNDPVGALTAEIRTVRQKIDSIDTVAADVKKLSADVTGMDTRLKSIEEVKGSISDKIDSLQADIVAITPKSKTKTASK